MKTDRKRQGLKGPVKSVRVETAEFEERDGQIGEKPWLSHTTTFNQDGWIIEQVNRNPDGSEWRTVHDYSDAGKLQATRGYDNSSLPSTEVIYIYNDELRLVSCASGSCSTEEVAGLTEEQKAEVAREIAQLFSPGTPMSNHAHRYDTKGRLVESKLTMMGMEASHQTYTYDDAGNKSEEMSYNQDGTVQNKAIFRRDYDEHGNWTKELVSTASSSDAEFGVSTPAHVTRRTITYE